MTYINYMSLLLLSNNLSKIVNILTIMLSWVWRLRTRGKKALRRYVFSKIMKTHQKFFTLKNLKGVAKQVDTFGIHRILTRIDSSDQQVVDMTCHPPLVSTDDHRLVYLLLRQAHIRQQSFIQPLHLGPSFTASNVFTGIFGVYLPNAKSLCQRFVDSCVHCRYFRRKAQQSQLGSPRYLRHIQRNNLVWRSLSFDPLGPFLRKAFPSSRKEISFFICIYYDVIVGGVNFKILDDVKHNSILRSLYDHCLDYCFPTDIYLDRGSSVNIRQFDVDYHKLFGHHDISVHVCPRESQFLNHSERFVRVTNDLLRSIFHNRGKPKYPRVLTFSEISTVLNVIKNIINNRVILTSVPGNSPVTPNTLYKSYDFILLRDDPDEWIQRKQLDLSFVQSAAVDCHELMTTYIRNLYKTDRNTTLQNKHTNDFQENDVVLVLRTKANFYGKVLKVDGPKCLVLSAETSPPSEIWLHSSTLVLLYRKCEDPQVILPDTGDETTDGNSGLWSQSSTTYNFFSRNCEPDNVVCFCPVNEIIEPHSPEDEMLVDDSLFSNHLYSFFNMPDGSQTTFIPPRSSINQNNVDN